MPDISMCNNKECKAHKSCYRFMAVPSSWQSYLVIKGKMDKCDHYWELRMEHKTKEKE